jgi:hypothetical protein
MTDDPHLAWQFSPALDLAAAAMAAFGAFVSLHVG